MFEEMTDEEIMANATLLAEVFIAHRQAHWLTADPWEMRKKIKVAELSADTKEKLDKLCRMNKIVNEVESLKDSEAENLYDGMLNAESPEEWREAVKISKRHKAEIDSLAAEFEELNKDC